MKAPKKIYLPNDKRMFDVYTSNLLENDISYISIIDMKEWAEKRKLELFEIFDGHLSVGISIFYDELLKFIEEEESIYKI